MNLRTLKKRCKRAVPVLIERHHFNPNAFEPSDGTEAIYSPPGMERRFCEHGFLKQGPLKGTMLLWEQNYWGEGDYKLPSEVLREIEFWSSRSDEDMRRLAEGGAQ